MANLLKKTDKTRRPTQATALCRLSIEEQAMMDHENDPLLADLMRSIMESPKSVLYKQRRCKLIAETFIAGIQIFKEISDGNQ